MVSLSNVCQDTKRTKIMQEEAVNIIVHQMADVKAQVGYGGCRRRSYLCSSVAHNVANVSFQLRLVSMVSPIRSRTVIDTNATVDNHCDNIIPALLAAHGLSGCDTVAWHSESWQLPLMY